VTQPSRVPSFDSIHTTAPSSSYGSSDRLDPSSQMRENTSLPRHISSYRLDLIHTTAPSSLGFKGLGRSESSDGPDLTQVEGEYIASSPQLNQHILNPNGYHGSTFQHRLHVVNNIIVRVLSHPRYRLDPYRRPGLIASTLSTRSMSSRSHRIHAIDSIHMSSRSHRIHAIDSIHI